MSEADIREVYEDLYKEYLKMERRFLLYQKCINQIDDYLEYNYENDSPKEIRDIILKIVDKLTESLKEL